MSPTSRSDAPDLPGLDARDLGVGALQALWRSAWDAPAAGQARAVPAESTTRAPRGPDRPAAGSEAAARGSCRTSHAPRRPRPCRRRCWRPGRRLPGHAAGRRRATARARASCPNRSGPRPRPAGAPVRSWGVEAVEPTAAAGHGVTKRSRAPSPSPSARPSADSTRTVAPLVSAARTATSTRRPSAGVRCPTASKVSRSRARC
jgi:hypothetical protein